MSTANYFHDFLGFKYKLSNMWVSLPKRVLPVSEKFLLNDKG